MSNILDLEKDFQRERNPAKAKILAGFFKTGEGEYGEGDKFLGVVVPKQRKTAGKYKDLKLVDLQKLLNSKIHEYRLTALFILVSKFEKVDEDGKKEIVDFYLGNTRNINNWDLVDLSAPNILGEYLLVREKGVLYKLAESKNLWERRIAILSTFRFLKNNQFENTLKISEILLSDKHDLIHKAVGWMLREVGKRDIKVLEEFLARNVKKMPRTTLRYAIEKFPEEKRQLYLGKSFKVKALVVT